MIFLLSSALAAPTSADLDGDGKNESIQIRDDEVVIGRASIPCGAMQPCSVEVVDARTGDSQKEVVLCEAGLRDEVNCRLYTYEARRAVQIPFSDGSEPPEILTNGSGIVRTRAWQDRLYTRTEKYLLRSGRLERVAQPFFAADEAVHIDRTFPITLEPGAGAVVANVAPNSDITVVLEHGSKDDFYLITVSSGLMGWVKLSDLVSASDELRQRMSAG